MKNFIYCLLLITGAIFYLNFATLMANPFDIIPRILFYLVIPLSICFTLLSMAVEALISGIINRTGIKDWFTSSESVGFLRLV